MPSKLKPKGKSKWDRVPTAFLGPHHVLSNPPTKNPSLTSLRPTVRIAPKRCTDTYDSAALPTLLTKRQRTPWSRCTWDAPNPDEAVVQKNGQVRQAGATQADGTWVHQLRRGAESSLYIFSKSVLKRRYFVPSLHLPICNWLQERKPDPDRKLLRCFREMGKTSMIAHATPLHMHIQPQENNCWFPNQAGSETRVLLVKETIEEAMRELRTVMGECEDNELLRALWPDRFWDDPRRQSRRWNQGALILPRKNEWPDESLRAMGVGGAIAGKHPSCIIKDDIISFQAANSPADMETAIMWHIASRALINKPGCLELILGTPWAIHDVYGYIEKHDNREHGGTVSILNQPLVVDGVCVYPEFTVDVDGAPMTYGFSPEKIAHLQKEFQTWLLQYQISVVDPSMVDFAEENLRWYEVQNGMLTFVEDARDDMLADLERMKSLKPADSPSVIRPFSEMDARERRTHIIRHRMVA